MKIIAKNKRATYDYTLLDFFEAGISLTGSEVKSIKEGNVDLTSSFIVFDEKNNLQWINAHIDHYKFQSMDLVDEKRTRQLLLHKKELRKIKEAIILKGLTVVPTKIYLNHRGLIKIEIATARGKKNYDKREAIKKREAEIIKNQFAKKI